MPQLTVLLAALCAVALAAPNDQLITNLPGLAQMPKFKMYSGYINVDAAHNKNMFYWFVESERSPAKDPLVLWMNGGPGSSSLRGLLTEHGPFRVNPDGKTLSAYPYSWNRVANVLYLEAPVGVGFSYSDVASDLTTDDQKTAADNYRFVVNWLEKFPEYRKNAFYVSGESYGGHYVPTLAAEILKQDKASAINFAGVLIGNPLINSDSWLWWGRDPGQDPWNYITFFYTHGLLPHEQYQNAVKACKWENYLENCADVYRWPDQQCLDAVDTCIEFIPKDVDPYNVNAPVCPTASRSLHYTAKWDPFTRAIAAHREQSKAHAVVAAIPRSSSDVDPCLDQYMEPYMNQPDVQKALNVKPTAWESYGNLNYSEASGYDNMVPLFQDFFRSQRKLRILVYSGDFDGCIPFMGTQKWIHCLGRPVMNGWRTWHYNGQVAGGIVNYDKISFLTIKGSGHMVPYYMPEQGYAFFESWIQGKDI